MSALPAEISISANTPQNQPSHIPLESATSSIGKNATNLLYYLKGNIVSLIPELQLGKYAANTDYPIVDEKTVNSPVMRAMTANKRQLFTVRAYAYDTLGNTYPVQQSYNLRYADSVDSWVGCPFHNDHDYSLLTIFNT
jgi:hypothetical protein